MITIIDYGMGNLRSVQKAFEHVGADACITQDPAVIRQAGHVVLPGVGAMAPAMDKLGALGLIPILKEVVAAGTPFLGICLGFQLLFDQSDEGGNVHGLGVIPGVVKRFPKGKVPHMGWNRLRVTQPACRLLAGVTDNEFVYFCHSYYVIPQDIQVMATQTDYHISFTSMISKDHIFGVQFHPEKSQALGLRILENFAQCEAAA